MNTTLISRWLILGFLSIAAFAVSAENPPQPLNQTELQAVRSQIDEIIAPFELITLRGLKISSKTLKSAGMSSTISETREIEGVLHTVSANIRNKGFSDASVRIYLKEGTVRRSILKPTDYGSMVLILADPSDAPEVEPIKYRRVVFVADDGTEDVVELTDTGWVRSRGSE